MPRSVESDQDSRGGKIGQTPVPALRGAGAVISGQEGFTGGPESPGVVGSNGEPDEVQEEVQHDHTG